MNYRRITAIALALPLTLAALAACEPPQGGSTAADSARTTTPASTASAASTTTARATATTAKRTGWCSPRFLPGTDGIGLTIADGQITGHMTPVCDPVPNPGASFVVSIALFYRPDTSVSTKASGAKNPGTYQITYTTAPVTCRPGLWYVGIAMNGTPTRGAQVDVTAQDCASDQL